MDTKPLFIMPAAALIVLGSALAATAAPAPAPAVVVPNAYVVSTNSDFRQVQRINGIVILNSLKDYNPDGVPLVANLTVKNLPILDTQEFRRLMDTYLAREMNEDRMRALQRDIVLYFRKNDRPLVDVLYPEQDVSNGMLQIVVIEGRLKTIQLQDAKGQPYTNGWSGQKYLFDSIRIRTNDVISESRLERDLDWLGRNPFRRVEAVYVPDSRDYGLTSLLLRVEEQRQWSLDVGFDNAGGEITGEDRFTFGATWGKAFGQVDHQARYAYTTDVAFDQLSAHSGSYYVPLPWQHGLRVIGYYLDFDGDVDSSVLLEGSAYQASFRYEIPLPSIGRYQQEVAFGLDFKSADNNLFFIGSTNSTPISETPTEIFQLAAVYSSTLPDRWGHTSFSAQGYYSPGDVTDKNTDEFFNAARPFSTADYMYARFNLERMTKLPGDFSWIVRGMAQVADGNLQPSEQLGLGGFATARGYDERESNGDQGVFISNELRTPPISMWSFIRKGSSVDEKLQFLAFYDWGFTANIDLLSGEEPRINFSSAGVGLRYVFSRYLSLRFDYGWQFESTGVGPEGQDSRGHVGIVATY